MRVAIAGLGAAAVGGHLPALARTPGVTVVAAADPDASRRASLPARFGDLPFFSAAETMLDSVGCDALVVSAGPGGHPSLAELGAWHGRHVICEKPLAITRADQLRVARAFDQRPDLALVPVHQYRFSPAWRLLQRWARLANRLGRPFWLDVELERPGTDARAASPWRRDATTSGGVLGDHGVHFLALAWTIGDDLRMLSVAPSGDAVRGERAAAQFRVGTGTAELRLSSTGSARRTSVSVRALGLTLRWTDAMLSVTLGGRVLAQRATAAISDRDHVDALYVPFYADVADGMSSPAWRRRQTAEALGVSASLVALLDAPCPG